MSKNDLVTPVILSGGSGNRLWPISTAERPKQFLNLVGPKSMFQTTLERSQVPDLFDKPVIVGNAQHADLAEKQMDEIGTVPEALILEPCARNTAPAIALAAFACNKPHSLMLVMPSDHVISDVPAFQEAVRNSLPLAKAHWLVTFGINPTGPETGYGYIQQGEAIGGSTDSFVVQQFVEKPNAKNAGKMLAEGDYYWNAGIFLFRADTYLRALEKHAPEMLKATKLAMDKARQSKLRIYPDENSFASAPSDSIDYAVMEKADKVAITPVNPGWSDVGSWDSLFEISDKDKSKNVTSGNVVALDSTNNLIHAEGIEVATYGVTDLIVVTNGQQVMIVPRGQSQHVKKIVEQLKNPD